MNPISPNIRRFAALLIQCEKSGEDETDLRAILNVCGKLKGPLSVLMGRAGYGAFLGRALALAGAEVSSLRAMRVSSDASLVGASELNHEAALADLTEGSVVFVSQLLGLLNSFMGEAILVRILREAWPQLKPGDLHFRNES